MPPDKRFHEGDPPPLLWSGLARLLRPLVRVLIRSGITYPQFLSLLKSVYVATARDDFPPPQGKQTDSRISVLTGVHRKDVRRLRSLTAEEFALPPSASLAAQIIGIWLGSPDYTDADGTPRRLPRSSADDAAGVSFDSLVETVTKDVRPRTLLDEWRDRGLISVDPDDHVRLLRDAFVPDDQANELAYYFGRNLHDHIAASAHNLSGPPNPFLERSVYYARLTPGSIKKIQELARRAGMTALKSVNELALALSNTDKSKPDATRRVSFGVYFYEDERDSDAPLNDADSDTATKQ